MAIKRYPGQVPGSEHEDMEWDKSVRHALLESQERLVKQRDGLKALLDEAQSLLLRYVEKGHRCEDDDKVIDWGKRCNKALREFGQ